MATTCPACSKTVSSEKPTCYYCGAFLAPRLECPKCKRAIPQTRSSCHFCGTSLAGAKTADGAAPVAVALPGDDAVAPAVATLKPKPAAPASLVVPDIQLEKGPGPFGAWLQTHQAEIDLALFAVALPIAACAIATQLLISALARMMSAGRS